LMPCFCSTSSTGLSPDASGPSSNVSASTCKRRQQEAMVCKAVAAHCALRMWLKQLLQAGDMG
jgi:hypothetical protein